MGKGEAMIRTSIACLVVVAFCHAAAAQINGGVVPPMTPPPPKRHRVAPHDTPTTPPKWQAASNETLSAAAEKQRPLVLYFPGNEPDPRDLMGHDFEALSVEHAVFIKLPLDSETGESEAAGLVPTSRIRCKTPCEAYGINPDRPCVLVCDWHGNEIFRNTGMFRAATLKDQLTEVPKRMDVFNTRLQRRLAQAQTHLDTDPKDEAAAMKQLVRALRDGLVGLPAAVAAAAKYTEMLSELRGRLEALSKADDLEGLKALARITKATDLEAEVAEAIKRLTPDKSE
jgi:hypothetical protein